MVSVGGEVEGAGKIWGEKKIVNCRRSANGPLPPSQTPAFDSQHNYLLRPW